MSTVHDIVDPPCRVDLRGAPPNRVERPSTPRSTGPIPARVKPQRDTLFARPQHCIAVYTVVYSICALRVGCSEERNLRARGFDFEFATQVFDGPTLERADTRRDYPSVGSWPLAGPMASP